MLPFLSPLVRSRSLGSSMWLTYPHIGAGQRAGPQTSVLDVWQLEPQCGPMLFSFHTKGNTEGLGKPFLS